MYKIEGTVPCYRFDVEAQERQCLWARTHAQNRKCPNLAARARAARCEPHDAHASMRAQTRSRSRARCALRAREWPLCMR